MCAYAGLFCLPQPWRDRARGQIRAFLISLSAIFLCFIPLLLHLDMFKTNWLPVPHLTDVAHLLLAISGTNRIYLLALALCCGLGLLAAVLPVYSRGGGGEEKGGDPCGRPASFHREGRGRPQGAPRHHPTSPPPPGPKPLFMPVFENPIPEIVS